MSALILSTFDLEIKTPLHTLMVVSAICLKIAHFPLQGKEKKTTQRNTGPKI